MSIIRSIFTKSIFPVGKDELNKTTVCSLGRVYMFGPFAQQETPSGLRFQNAELPRGLRDQSVGAEADDKRGSHVPEVPEVPVSPQTLQSENSVISTDPAQLCPLAPDWTAALSLRLRLEKLPCVWGRTVLVLKVQVLRCQDDAPRGRTPMPGGGGDSGVCPARVPGAGRGSSLHCPLVLHVCIFGLMPGADGVTWPVLYEARCWKGDMPKGPGSSGRGETTSQQEIGAIFPDQWGKESGLGGRCD